MEVEKGRREIDRANVVAVDEGGTLEGAVELLEKLAQLIGLDHTVGHSTVLGPRWLWVGGRG